ncbi:uncharacterized protein LOC120090869 [Benincasa hispida]|uniref:uncharacterized protein LOC120090869 n=1 Tax=Benincasa hispida TaxID=102211 RepID=UPI001902AF9B|nr:uncharacterized protein LOC120090869 [Benincasa hispida]
MTDQAEEQMVLSPIASNVNQGKKGDVPVSSKSGSSSEPSPAVLNALEQMPNYVKFMKEMLSSKKKFEKYETISINKECSAILQKKLPQKLKDPGSFTIPYTIGNLTVNKALCDLRASINLMPLSLYRKVDIGEVQPTMISLQQVDRTLTYPRGVVEDVLVEVGDFIFPADFVVLDMEENSEIPIILGKPFLATVGH